MVLHNILRIIEHTVKFNIIINKGSGQSLEIKRAIINLQMSKNKMITDDSEEQQQESDQQKNKLQFNRPKIDRILKDTINFKKIIINVSMTQYPVVAEVAEELNWKVQTDPEAGDWDVFWTDYSIEPDILIRMHLHQKINYSPGVYVIARKNLLGMNLMSMRNKFPDEYNFFPLTWMLPSQYSQFRLYYQSVKKGKVRTYIAKPEAQCQGRGIFLTRDIQDLQNGSHYVVQRYINKPYLIDNLKFDLRIYVLLAGNDPLRVYLYQEGLARFATQSYVQPNNSNLDETFIHLTNYAINKFNPKFIFNKGVNDMSSGHKRSLTSVYKLLEKKGENVVLLKEKIKSIIIKTLITSNPLMSHQYSYSQPEEYSSNMCFHILGFDPLLLEVNHTPSFTTDTPLDDHIKHSLIRDTLVLMNINIKSKAALFKKAKRLNNERLLTGKRQIFQGEMRKNLIDKAQLQRDQYQNKHLGRFQRIYPCQDQSTQLSYQTMLQYARRVYLEENTLRAKMQERQSKKMIKQQRRLFRLKKENKVNTPSIKQKPLSIKLNMIKSTITEKKNPKSKDERMVVSQVKLHHQTADQNADRNAKKSRPIVQTDNINTIKQNLERNLGLRAFEPRYSNGIFNSGNFLGEVAKKDKSSVSFKGVVDIKNLDYRMKFSRIRKPQQEPRHYSKNGNFVMPKIFDINVQEQRQNYTIIKMSNGQ